MKRIMLILGTIMFTISACSQATDSADIKKLGAKSDGITDVTRVFKDAGKYKTLRIPKGRYLLDRTQVPFTNFILDSGAEIVSNTYAPYLPGKILRNESYHQTKFSYKYYNPVVNVSTVLEAKKDVFRYNHDAAITYFDGYFYVLWNGLATGGKDNSSEGSKGQLNYMSRSTDTRHWSTPVAIFDDPDYTNNPISNDRAADGEQWQPNMIALADRMLIIWTETGRVTASYISILLKGQKKLTTYRIDVNTQTKAIKLTSDLASQPSAGYSFNYPDTDTSYFIYATQDPYQLTTGRLLIPFSVEEFGNAFISKKKWASFIYSDNPSDLNSFKFAGLTQGTTPASAWEPFFSEGRDGTVYMHMRNLGPAQGANNNDKNMDIASSTDGIHFETAASQALVGPSSRAYCERISNNRFMMVYNDADKNQRTNGVANFSRLGSYDFTPGVSLQKDAGEPGDVYLNYPQSVIYRDTAYVVYSSVYEPRGIMLAKFRLGLPDDSLLVVPRNRPRVYISGYVDAAHKAIALTGSKTFKLNKSMIIGDGDAVNTAQSFTMGAWVSKQSDHSTGTLFDNRGSIPAADYSGKGIAICVSYIGMGSSGPGINLTANLNYNFNKSGYKGLVEQLLTHNTYLGVTVNTPSKNMAIYMDDGSYVSGNASQFYESNYYWQAIEVGDNFRDGETITIDDKTFTFRNSPSSNPTDVQINPSLAVTCSNLKAKATNVITAGWGQNGGVAKSGKILMVFFKNGSPLSPITSTNRHISNYDRNFIDGPTASIGSSIENSGLPGFAGYLYNMRVYRGSQAAKSSGVHRYLFNRLCPEFGYTPKSGAVPDNDSYYANIQYDNSGSIGNAMKDATTAEYTYANNFLTLHSNSSAGIETDGDNYNITIPFKVSNATDISPVICTFQDGDHSYAVTIDRSGIIKCNGTRIKTVNPNIVNNITLSYRNNTITLEGTFNYQFGQRPIIFLGVANFFAPMDGNYSITYDLSRLTLNIIK